MSKYRFAGVVREIKSFPSGKTDNEVGFIPDREYAVTEKRSKDEILFVVLLPEDGGWPADFMQNFQKTPCQPEC